jgi:hypothetical protein
LGHVGFAVAAVERGDERALGVVGPVGELITRPGVLDLLPLLAVEANAGEAFVDGEYDLAALVVEGFALVLLEHGKLDAIDDEELVEVEVQGERGKGVEFD